jgi:4a-hydroxytetrahydrobiopterin dehydratase
VTIDELRAAKCAPLKGKQHALDDAHARELAALLPAWQLGDGQISRQFRFADFAQALAFVNALGWIAEQQNHHPDLELGWGRCSVRFSTHDVGGLSMNDFICAAKADTLLAH